jgi:hypothetical protein
MELEIVGSTFPLRGNREVMSGDESILEIGPRCRLVRRTDLSERLPDRCISSHEGPWLPVVTTVMSQRPIRPGVMTAALEGSRPKGGDEHENTIPNHRNLAEP